KLIVLSAEAERFLRQCPFDDRQSFLKTVVLLFKGHLETAQSTRVVAAAGTQFQTSARHNVERTDCLSQANGVRERQQKDGAAQLDPFRFTCDCSEHRLWI